jgi:hypothetical protein
MKITAESFTAELADVANQLQAFHNGQFQVVPRIHQRDFMGEALNDVNEELRDLAERQCLDAASAIDLLNDIEWGRA